MFLVKYNVMVLFSWSLQRDSAAHLLPIMWSKISCCWWCFPHSDRERVAGLASWCVSSCTGGTICGSDYLASSDQTASLWQRIRASLLLVMIPPCLSSWKHNKNSQAIGKKNETVIWLCPTEPNFALVNGVKNLDPF